MSSKEIRVKQNTKEWREWRNKGLGASDAPIVMGVSPWTSRFELWSYKTGLIQRSEPNGFQVAAMQRGHDLEPEARRRAEEVYLKAKFPATSFEHSEHSFLRASLDGYNAETNSNLEIKCPGKADHQTALEGRVPKKYIPQIQMQMLVSGAHLTYYFSWDGKDSDILITVQEDKRYQEVLLQEMRSFWNLIQSGVPPEISEKETKQLLSQLEKDIIKITQSVKALSYIVNKQPAPALDGDGFAKVS
jgi:putative phage-type endonuclease